MPIGIARAIATAVAIAMATAIAVAKAIATAKLAIIEFCNNRVSPDRTIHIDFWRVTCVFVFGWGDFFGKGLEVKLQAGIQSKFILSCFENIGEVPPQKSRMSTKKMQESQQNIEFQGLRM